MAETAAEPKRLRKSENVTTADAVGGQRAADAAERSLGRAVAFALPALSVVAALVVGAIASLGSALLVIAAGTLLGAIALLWASIRTLSGDAPLPLDLDALAARGHAVDELAERKRRVLGALKDLENEHALGKIDNADYEAFVARYRDEAKQIMREMDQRIAPKRAEAERLAREYLAQQGLGKGGTPANRVSSSPKASGRIVCAGCQASNEPDAVFCKSCGGAVRHPEKS